MSSSRGSRGRPNGNTPDDEAGDDFLKLEVPKVFTKQAKASISSVVFYHGKKKLQSKSPGYAAEQRKALQSMIPFAAALTGNVDQVWAVACCIEEGKVRSYDLRMKDYTLPPCQVGFKDASTLQSSMVKVVKDSYKRFIDSEKKDYEKVYGAGSYIGASDFDSQLQPLLGEITRFHIKYWYLNPHLNRKEAYLEGKALLESKFKKKGDCKRIIDELLLASKVDGYTKDLMNLEMQDAPDDYENAPEGAKVFVENESAQVVLECFIRVYGIEVPKGGILDYLEPLQAWINNGATEEEKNKFGKFLSLVPKQTAGYLKRKAEKDEKEATKERKKREAEERKAKAEEKKKQKLETFKEKLAEAANNHDDAVMDDAVTVSPPPGNNARANTAAQGFLSGFDGSLGTNATPGNNNAQAAAANSRPMLTPEELDDMFKDDPYAEYKLPIKSFKLMDAVLNEKRRSSRKLPSSCGTRRETPEDHSGIKKTIVSITRDGMVTVLYMSPGGLWMAAVKARLVTIIHAVNVMEQLVPDFVTHALPPEGHDGNIDDVIAKVVMAVFMHAMALNTSQLNSFRLHDSFHGPTFVADLANTLNSWYPPLLRGNWVQLYTFRGLMNAKEEVGGICLRDRREKMSEIIKSRDHFTSEQEKTIFQIVQLLEVVDSLYDQPNKKIGGRESMFDPFLTNTQVFQNMELVSKNVEPRSQDPRNNSPQDDGTEDILQG